MSWPSDEENRFVNSVAQITVTGWPDCFLMPEAFSMAFYGIDLPFVGSH